MELIIFGVIIYFVYRHMQNKKFKKKAQAMDKAINSGSLNRPLKARQLRGKAVAPSDLPRKMDDLISGSDYGYVGKGDYNPDFSFACTKQIYEKYLAARRESGFNVRDEENCQAARFINYGVTLAENYRDGYGCDPDPKAAIQIIQEIVEFWQTQQGNPNTRTEVGADLARRVADGLLCMADAYAMDGNEPEANRYYRMAFASSAVFGNPAYVKSNVIKHAMGDWGADNVRPVCLTVASELAMALAGEGNAMGGHYLVSLTEIRNLPLADLGRSWKKDYEIYSQAGGAYPQYRLGLAKLYGLGVQQDVNAGLKQLEQAYEQGSVQAASMLSDYYSSLRYEGGFDKVGQQAVERQSNDWSTKYERMKKDTSALKRIMDTGIINEEAASQADKYAPKYTPSQSSAQEEDHAPRSSVRETAAAANENPLACMPSIIYDDSNRQWKRRGIFGDHAEYYNDDDTVTIYHADVFGNSANTSAGTFHWY